LLSVGALTAALKITVWFDPGVRTKAAGEAVTPAGRPEKLTLIGALYPFNPVVVIVTEVVALGYVAAAVKIPEESVKSGVVEMVSASDVLAAKDPLEPLN
jgi:hypothetical protein